MLSIFAIKTRTIMKEKSLHYSNYKKVHDVTNKLERWSQDNYNLKISETLTEDDYNLMNAWLIVEGDWIADYTRYMYPDSSDKADYEKAYEYALHLVKLSKDMLLTYVEAIKNYRMKK